MPPLTRSGASTAQYVPAKFIAYGGEGGIGGFVIVYTCLPLDSDF